MSYKIVADSSANLQGLEGVAYASVPLKIVTAEKEYVDDAGLDTVRMLKELAAYKGRSGTACPSVGEWLEAFGQAENVFAVTITSSLSGGYNSCVQAKAEYELSGGPRLHQPRLQRAGGPGTGGADQGPLSPGGDFHPALCGALFLLWGEGSRHGRL